MAMMGGGWAVWLGIGTATRLLQGARNGLDLFLARLFKEKNASVSFEFRTGSFSCSVSFRCLLPCSRGIWPAIQGLAPVPIL